MDDDDDDDDDDDVICILSIASCSFLCLLFLWCIIVIVGSQKMLIFEAE